MVTELNVTIYCVYWVDTLSIVLSLAVCWLGKYRFERYCSHTILYMGTSSRKHFPHFSTSTFCSRIFGQVCICDLNALFAMYKSYYIIDTNKMNRGDQQLRLTRLLPVHLYQQGRCLVWLSLCIVIMLSSLSPQGGSKVNINSY